MTFDELFSKDEEEESKVYRLTDIDTQKVDFVDRPANKKPFFLMKRDNTMTEEVKTLDLSGVDKEDIVISKSTEEVVAEKAAKEEAKDESGETKSKHKNKFMKAIDSAKAKLDGLAGKISAMDDDTAAAAVKSSGLGAMLGAPTEKAEEAEVVEEVATEEVVEEVAEEVVVEAEKSEEPTMAELLATVNELKASLLQKSEVVEEPEETVEVEAPAVDGLKEELAKSKERVAALAVELKVAKSDVKQSNSEVEEVEKAETVEVWPYDFNKKQVGQ